MFLSVNRWNKEVQAYIPTWTDGYFFSVYDVQHTFQWSLYSDVSPASVLNYLTASLQFCDTLTQCSLVQSTVDRPLPQLVVNMQEMTAVFRCSSQTYHILDQLSIASLHGSLHRLPATIGCSKGRSVIPWVPVAVRHFANWYTR